MFSAVCQEAYLSSLCIFILCLKRKRRKSVWRISPWPLTPNTRSKTTTTFTKNLECKHLLKKYLTQTLNLPDERTFNTVQIILWLKLKSNCTASYFQWEVWPSVPAVPQRDGSGVCWEVLPSPNLQGEGGSSQRDRTNELSSPLKTGPMSGSLRHTPRDGHDHGIVSK